MLTLRVKAVQEVSNNNNISVSKTNSNAKSY